MGKGGSSAAVKESKKARRESTALSKASLKAQDKQFRAWLASQEKQAAEMARLARQAPAASESSTDQAFAADEAVGFAALRPGFAKFPFPRPGGGLR